MNVVVDLFLKRRLLKEASKDIFHHLLGFDLPLEARDALRDFVGNNRSYSQKTIMDISLSKRDATTVQVHWNNDSDIVAVTATEYFPHLSFQECEEGKIEEVLITSSSHPEWNHAYPSPELKKEPDEPMVFSWTGKKIRMRKGDSLHVHSKYVTKGPLMGAIVQSFGTTPTIHPRVRVNPNVDFEVYASHPDERNGIEYLYNKVFLVGDRIQIRWKPKIPIPVVKG